MDQIQKLYTCTRTHAQRSEEVDVWVAAENPVGRLRERPITITAIRQNNTFNRWASLTGHCQKYHKYLRQTIRRRAHYTVLLRKQMETMRSFKNIRNTPGRPTRFDGARARVCVNRILILMGLRFHLNFYRSTAFKSRPYFYPTILFFIHLFGSGDLYAVISMATFAVSLALTRSLARSLVVCHRACCQLVLLLLSSSSTATVRHFTENFIPLIIDQENKRVTIRIARTTQYINNLFLGDHWNVFEQKVCCALTSHWFYSA